MGSEEEIEQNTYHELLDLGDSYLIPGLINSHAHACFLTDGRPFEEQMEIPPNIMMLAA